MSRVSTSAVKHKKMERYLEFVGAGGLFFVKMNKKWIACDAFTSHVQCTELFV